MHRPRITNALVRQISRSLPNCALVHVPRQDFNLDRAKQQHAEYVAALESAGVKVTVLPEQPDLSDAAFVEDPVVVLDETAIICRLGTASREPESDTMVGPVSAYRSIQKIMPPGTVEGGDVLRIGKTLFAGVSSRTNAEGIRQLQRIVNPFGYRVAAIEVQKCLHLKTAITSPADGLLIANPAWMDFSLFPGFEIVAVPPNEPWAANTLAVNGQVLVSGPKTADLLKSRGLNARHLDISELQKAEAGLTCLSVTFT